MASDAEIDLLVNASRALGELERDLDRLINTAEANADPVLIAATLDRTLALRNMRRELDEAVRVAQAGAPDIRVRADVDVDDDDIGRVNNLKVGLLTLGIVAGRNIGPLAGLAGSIGAAGAAAGGALPLLAGLVVAVESVLPAAALATSGLLTLKLATATVQIAMIGVKDAIATAFDPDATPEELAESMKKLGPHARDFVKELQGMRKGFKAIQIDVQNRLFANLDKSLERTAKAVLPSLHGALDRTADSLNDMARGAATAAQELGERGILGSALASSTKAMSELERIPGQAVTAFGQLAAAAGPAMEGLAKRVGGAADRIAEKLSKAFESGALEEAINIAVSNLDQLFRSIGNIGKGIGNIFKTLSVDGEGLFGTLEKVTQAFEDLTASKEFEGALKALSGTMKVLVETVLPLLKDAFAALLPIFEIIAPPIQNLIKHLGVELAPVIEELKPVLEELGIAFGKLIPVLEPFLNLAIRLAVLILPILAKAFEFLGEVFERLAPFAKVLADNLEKQLRPILEKIPEILDKILPKLLELADRLFPLLIDLLEQIGPSLGRMAESLADLLVELTPLLVKFLEFQIFLVDKMLPIIAPLVEGFGKLLVGALSLFTEFIREFVIPGVRVVVQILNGDFRGAALGAAAIIEHLRDRASRAFESMKNRLISLAGQLIVGLVNKASQLGSQFVAQIQSLVNRAIERMAQLPIGMLNAVGNLASMMFRVGSDAVQGLINGLTSRIGGIVGAAAKIAASIPSTVKDLLNIGSPSKVMIEVGEDTMAGLLKGLSDSLPELRAQVTSIAAVIPQSVAQPSVSGLALGNSNFLRPSVNVYIGNQRLNGYIDTRVDQSRRRNTLVDAHGRRR